MSQRLSRCLIVKERGPFSYTKAKQKLKQNPCFLFLFLFEGKGMLWTGFCYVQMSLSKERGLGERTSGGSMYRIIENGENEIFKQLTNKFELRALREEVPCVLQQNDFGESVLWWGVAPVFLAPPSPRSPTCLFFFFQRLFIYLLLGERERAVVPCEGGRGRGRRRERISSRSLLRMEPQDPEVRPELKSRVGHKPTKLPRHPSHMSLDGSMCTEKQ